MPMIYLETFIKASPEVVFDLSRSIELHKSSMAHHKEKVIAGIETGLMNKEDMVTWKAVHLFKNRILKVQITEMNAPHFFKDEMLEGDFEEMKHEHYFKPSGDETLMIDKFYFSSPFGILGKLVNKLFLKTYMTRLLERRNSEIKKIAESTQCK
jgi:ligand-binding SRPBCC domain-containing protein